MSVRDVQSALAEEGYVAGWGLAKALHLAESLGQPLLLEGPVGVGKTDVARAMAAVHGTRLIRLTCHEAPDARHATYEWPNQRELLMRRAAEARYGMAEAALFGEEYLLKSPLLEAVTQAQPAVLLIDEIDRADEAFEADLIGVLSDFQTIIPEMSTILAVSQPMVILTANGTRALSQALRQQCLYAHVDYPDCETELAILRTRMPQIEGLLARQIVNAVQNVRRKEGEGVPGITEMLDWAAALAGLGVTDLAQGPEAVQAARVGLLKTAVVPPP